MQMNCNVCMDEDIEAPVELMACGNDGCTFRMCKSCTRSYYGRRYGYRKCPQCRSSPLGREVRLFIPAVPTEPAAIGRFPQPPSESHPSLICVYLGICTLLAWFVGATICEVLQVKIDSGVYVLYQIVVGYIWLACLVLCVLMCRSLCNRICAPPPE